MTVNSLLSAATARGRKPEPLAAHTSRALTEEDLLELALPGSGAPQAKIRELRTSHHNVARLLAQGSKVIDVARITGYTSARIEQLKADPQFQELLAYYEGLDAKRWEDAREDIALRLRAITVDSIEVIHSRLLDDPDKFELKELRSLAELGLDRIGHGKTSTQNVNTIHSFDEEQLARIRGSADAPAEVGEEDRAALVRLAVLATELHPAGEEGERIEGEGAGLREEGRTGTSDAARTTIHVPSVDHLPRG